MKIFYYRLRHVLFNLITRLIHIPLPALKSGSYSTENLNGLLPDQNRGKLLVVTDKGIIETGLIDKLDLALKKSCTPYHLFSEVKPNPDVENIEAGLNVYLQNNCRGIIAFGGGSPIDCAKMIAARVTNRIPVLKMKGLFKVRHKLPYLMAVPTTAGTGSEATIVAVITDEVNREKFSIIDPRLAPAACILDPQLTVNLPPHLTAETGMDALTHAVEAYISLVGTPFSNQKALEAAKLIFAHLENSYHDGEDLKAREAMLEAAHYAGIAFTRNYVGYVHAVAHSLGGFYNLSHGLANAVVLPEILELSREAAASKLAELALNAGMGSNSESKQALAGKLIARIREMNENMSIPAGIKEIRKEDIPELAEKIDREANPAYPVPKILFKSDFEKLLHRLMG